MLPVALSRYAVLKALYELGWEPKKAERFSVDHLVNILNVKENYLPYIQFFLRSLTKDDVDLLETLDTEEKTFQFVSEPPTREWIEARLKHVTGPNDVERDHYRLLKELEKNLSNIMAGTVDPLSLLFPEDPTKPSAGKFYSECKKPSLIGALETYTSKQIRSSIDNYRNVSQLTSRPIYRMLEIGAGTGVFTKSFLERFPSIVQDHADFEFYFTDVTQAFFSSAEKSFAKYKKFIVFKKYDMEKDPLEQNLCPGYFDIIITAEVLHIARDVRRTLKRVRSLLKPGGLLEIVETVYPDERITFIFGLLDGYWQFEDRDFRRYHTTLTPELWKTALESSGFHKVSCVTAYENVHGMIFAHATPGENNFLKDLGPRRYSWIVFGDNDDELTRRLCEKLENVNRRCIIASKPEEIPSEDNVLEYLGETFGLASGGESAIEGIVYLWPLLLSRTRDQKEVSLPFVSLCKLVSRQQTPPRVFSVVSGTCAIESFETIDPTPGTLVGFCRSLANENPTLKLTYLDLDPSKNSIDQVDELFANLWVEHKQGAAFRDGLRLQPKLTAAKIVFNDPLTLPAGCERFQLVLPKTKLISDLDFAYLEPYQIAAEEVEVQVKATALNFRDVFTVLKPIPLFEKFNTVGLDFCGVVTKVGDAVTRFRVGDRVVGINKDEDNLSLPSHIRAAESRLMKLPEHMTIAEGSTLPTVFFTAIHCLIHIGKMRRGETVLIHTASGGVGIGAIQLCKHHGVNVIATAGAPRKQAFLRSMGVEHVFHSRTTDFKKDILEVTGGRGVDIVLNSLTGPGFKEASLDCLRTNGRFIEMSKLNTWKQEEVKALRPDVYYKIADLTSLESFEQEKLLKQTQDLMDAGTVKPIPYERFDTMNIRGALNYLQKAKHIGKIVCIMPEINLRNSQLVVSTPLFNDVSTYVITGGLGGIGFVVARWMLKNGAKHIALLGRSSPKPDVAEEIETWNSAGNHVRAFSVDIGNYNQCKAFFDELKKPELKFPPVRGIMHAAGVLSDATLENQSWDKFLHTYNPKVSGSWNLHDLTKDCNLEHFVLFSSIAATFGSPGQSNHSASNAFEDCLAAYRRSRGLTATSINWGNWGEVGVATEVDFPGARPIATAQGLLALETVLKTPNHHVTVHNVESFSMVLKLFPLVKYYVDDVRLFGEAKASLTLNSDEFWNAVDSAPHHGTRIDHFKKLIKSVVRNVLRLEPDEAVDDKADFKTLGIDSLMLLEMVNSLQNILSGRLTLSPSQLKDCSNVNALSSALLDLLESKAELDNALSPEELKQLIRDDSDLLPESLSANNLEAKAVDEVEVVLLTDVIDNIGPYFLRDLIMRPNIRKVYCLVPPTRKASAESIMKELNFVEGIEMNKVELLEGDITSPKFGLDEERYLQLCEDVDAVIHNAAQEDYTARYWKAPISQTSHVRTVNVLGTVHVLEFAATRRLKHVFHKSTALVYAGSGKDGQLSESWQTVSAFDSRNAVGKLGYILSKHISEQLVHQALLRGIPCKAFRFPHIAGDSRTGKLNYENNHALLRWLTYLKLGAVHDLPFPLTVVPCDHCARISLDIFFNPEAPMDVFNIVQPIMSVEQVLVDVAMEFGIQMEIIPYSEFMERLKSEADNLDLRGSSGIFDEQEESNAIAFMPARSESALKALLEHSGNLFNTSRLACYSDAYENLMEDTRQILVRDFKYLEREGVFEKFGIVSHGSKYEKHMC